MKTGIVILAAGESARMGTPKQLLAYRNVSLLQHAIDTALGIPDARVVVVLGAHAAEIRETLAGRDVLVAENRDWAAGMCGSLRAGLGSLLAEDPVLPRVLFLTCDQPALTRAHLRELIATHERCGRAIVASAYDGTLGVPALFDHSLFAELLSLTGAAGARTVIRAHPDQTIGVSCPEAAIDIDTPSDYQLLLNPLPAAAHA